MICRLCLQESKLVDAHIIPRSFFEAAKPSRQSHLILASKNPRVFPKKSRIGIYDSTILCGACEQRFCAWDDYAARLLLATPVERDLKRDRAGKCESRVIAKYDYEKLIMFFVSLLWRASASSQPFYSKVNVGPYEDPLRQMILQQKIDSGELVSVVLTQFVNCTLPQTFYNPASIRFGSVNHWVFYFATYMAFVKLDKRPMPLPIGKAMLQPDKPLLITFIDFSKTPHKHVHNAIAAIARAHIAAKKR